MQQQCQRKQPRLAQKTIDEVKARARVEDVIGRRVALSRSGGELVGLCPFHEDKSPSLRIDPAKNVWNCSPCRGAKKLHGGDGDAIGFVRKIERVGFIDAVRLLAVDLGIEVEIESEPRKVATYRYTDERGALLGLKERWEPGHKRDGKPKSFLWRAPDGRPGKPASCNTLYRLDEVAAAISEGQPVLVVEGEKCADACAQRGFVATTCEDGAGGKWAPHHARLLEGARVLVLADNDKTGREHAADVLRSLVGIADDARPLDLPGLRERADVFDWFADHTAGELHALIDAAFAAAPAADALPSVLEPGLIRLADVAPEVVTWLWHGRIPYGKITVLDGDPGLGKSTITIDIAARVTTGRAMPDESVSSSRSAVLFLTAEDGVADTIVPRLAAAGGDASRVFVLASVEDDNGKPRPPMLPADIDRVAGIVRQHGIRLVIVDPLMAFLGGGVDSFKDHDIRRALHPLAVMAEHEGVALVIVRHLNKGTGSAIYRGGGSIGIIGAARSGLIVGKHPGDETRRVFASTKCNLAAPPTSLEYSVQTTDNVGRIVWHGVSEHRAEALVVREADDDERSTVDEVAAHLERLVTDAGGEILVADAQKAIRGLGFACTDKTIQRARRKAGIEADRSGFQGKGVWRFTAPKQSGQRGQQSGQETPTHVQPVQNGNAVQNERESHKKHPEGPSLPTVDRWTGPRGAAANDDRDAA